mgnify:CR=1 FL=1
MTNYQSINNLKVSKDLYLFVNNELLKDTDISPEKFWLGFDKIVHKLTPINKELIKTRESLQKKIDEWHIKNKSNEIKFEDYKKFLLQIGYLKEKGPDGKYNNPHKSKGKKCLPPTMTRMVILMLCPPFALFLHLGLMGWVSIIICSLLTVYGFYFPGLIYATLHILC